MAPPAQTGSSITPTSTASSDNNSQQALGHRLGGSGLTGGAVYAALTATAFNTTAQTVTSSTLSLTYVNNGVGWPTTISNMAPTDVVNRYVNLTNGSGLAAINLTLGVADATTTTLTSDATHGLLPP